MERRKFLTLAGSILLPETVLAQNLVMQTGDLRLADAPIRSVFEMIFKSFNQNNYVIDNKVIGFETLTAIGMDFESLLTLACRASPQALEWTGTNNVYVVRPVPDQPEPARSFLDTLRAAKLPMVEEIPCRMAGCLLGRKLPHAILEIGAPGAPPDSTVSIVTLDSEVMLKEKRYRVGQITRKNIVLVGDKKQLQIPYAPLIHKKR